MMPQACGAWAHTRSAVLRGIVNGHTIQAALRLAGCGRRGQERRASFVGEERDRAPVCVWQGRNHGRRCVHHVAQVWTFQQRCYDSRRGAA